MSECKRCGRDRASVCDSCDDAQAFWEESLRQRTRERDEALASLAKELSAKAAALEAVRGSTPAHWQKLEQERDGWKRAAESQNRQWSAKCTEATELRAEVERLKAENAALLNAFPEYGSTGNELREARAMFKQAVKEKVDALAWWNEAKADAARLRKDLREWLSEVEAGEADSENEHAGCLRNAADRIVVALAGDRS